jgi:membrane-bound inhibitor of C-type lysozyme
MRVASVFAAALAAGLAVSAPVSADTPMQPPMNDFNEAFYVCDGANFAVSYDSDTPTAATLTTSNAKKYDLKRTTAPSGVQFTEDPVKFWTDGKTVVVQGAGGSFQNCKRKTS